MKHERGNECTMKEKGKARWRLEQSTREAVSGRQQEQSVGVQGVVED